MNVGKLLLWTMIVHIAFKWEQKETTNSSNIYGDDINLPNTESLARIYIYIYILWKWLLEFKFGELSTFLLSIKKTLPVIFNNFVCNLRTGMSNRTMTFTVLT